MPRRVALFILFLYLMPSASAVGFLYKDLEVTEVDINQFELWFTVPKTFPESVICSQVIAEKVANIEVTECGKRYSIDAQWSRATIKGYLKDYRANGGKNHLFNPWWNTSWDLKQIYNVTYGKTDIQTCIPESYNKSDRWLYNDTTQVSHWNDSYCGVWVKLPANGS